MAALRPLCPGEDLRIQTSNPRTRNPARRANDLDGAAWTRHSISIWSDLRKTAAEAALRHPAMFPLALPARLIECFTRQGPGLVLDPFAGIGSTPLAACMTGKDGLGMELSAEYLALAQERCRAASEPGPLPGAFRMVQQDARLLEQYVEPSSVDLCITSPPYWNILAQKRSADGKAIRNYGSHPADLGTIEDYEEFLTALQGIFSRVLTALRPGAYCCIVVMDIRKGKCFYPFHSDLARRLQESGFIFDDLVIWDRRQEYNNLRPLGYPSVFRINKVHEFILITRKPGADGQPVNQSMGQ